MMGIPIPTKISWIGALRGTLAALAVFYVPAPLAQSCWHQLQGIGEVEFSDGGFRLYGSGLSITPDGRQICGLVAGKGLAHGNGKYVVVGSSTLSGQDFSISTNGFNWTNIVANIPGVSRIAFGNGQFVVVGPKGAVASSVEGKKWLSQSVVTNSLNGLIFSGGRFVTVGQGVILVSETGTNWVKGDLPDAYDLHTVTWANDLYVAAGVGAILTSLDGMQWTTRKSDTNLLITSVCWDGKNFLAAGRMSNTDLIYRSSDGMAWEDMTPSPPFVTSIAYGNEIYLAAGQEKHTLGTETIRGPSTLYRSTDGVQWEDYYSNIPGGRPISSLCHGPAGWVAGLRAGGFLHSESGLKWEYIHTPGSTVWDIEYALGQYIASGPSSGTFFVSTDGVSWLSATGRVAGVSEPQRIKSGNDIVAVLYPSEKVLASSHDLNSWKSVSVGITNPTCLTFGQGKFVLGGTSSFAISTDAADWSRVVTLTTPFFAPVDVYGCDAGFVAVSAAGAIAYSTDALDWTVVNLPGRPSLRQVTYGGGTWVAAGDRGAIAISRDGLEWSVSTDSSKALYEAISYADNMFMAVSDAGTVTISPVPNLSLINQESSFSLMMPPVSGSTELLSSEDLQAWHTILSYPSGTFGGPVPILNDSPRSLFKLRMNR